MSFETACEHNRNYGCRLRRYVQNGIEMLSLENRRLKAVLSLGKGADIVELLHKPTDTEFLWHSFNEQKNLFHAQTQNSAAGNFFEGYAGGWQELFPTYGDNTVYEGAEIGIHGEACLYPWDCRVLEDTPDCVSVELSLRTVRTPFLLRKTVTLRGDAAKLEIAQVVTNVSDAPRDFMWAHHPAFGYPFLDASVELRLPGHPKVTVPEETALPESPFDRAVTGRWPFVTGRGGAEIDLRPAHAADEKLYMEYYISELDEPRYELVNRGKGLGIRMEWDGETFPYLWIWGMYCGMDGYPWYGRAYTLGVEPWSTVPADYQKASKNHETLVLGPGETRTARISAELFEE